MPLYNDRSLYIMTLYIMVKISLYNALYIINLDQLLNIIDISDVQGPPEFLSHIKMVPHGETKRWHHGSLMFVLTNYRCYIMWRHP